MHQKAVICRSTLAKGTPDNRVFVDKLKALQAQGKALPCRMTQRKSIVGTRDRYGHKWAREGYSKCEPVTKDAQLPKGILNTDYVGRYSPRKVN